MPDEPGKEVPSSRLWRTAALGRLAATEAAKYAGTRAANLTRSPAVANEALGRRHVSYHVKEEHYPVVVEAMLQTLAECLGEDFPPDVCTAWESALNFVSDVMKQGATEAIP